jgi:hypothetical protein
MFHLGRSMTAQETSEWWASQYWTIAEREIAAVAANEAKRQGHGVHQQPICARARAHEHYRSLVSGY